MEASVAVAAAPAMPQVASLLPLAEACRGQALVSASAPISLVCGAALVERAALAARALVAAVRVVMHRSAWHQMAT